MIELLIQAEQTLSLGLLDEAERLYRLAAEGDPNNAIAIVGLSRVALERGDERAALALARQALAIDPESSTARRMVDRLEETISWPGGEAMPGAAAPAPVEPAEAPAPAEVVPYPAPAEIVPSPAPPDVAAASAEVVPSPPPDTVPAPRQSPARGLLRRLTRRS